MSAAEGLGLVILLVIGGDHPLKGSYLWRGKICRLLSGIELCNEREVALGKVLGFVTLILTLYLSGHGYIVIFNFCSPPTEIGMSVIKTGVRPDVGHLGKVGRK